MALKIPGYLKKAHKDSTKEGWIWEYKGSKHLMVFSPDGTRVTTISLTAYDGTLTKKVQSQLRRHKCPGI